MQITEVRIRLANEDLTMNFDRRRSPEAPHSLWPPRLVWMIFAAQSKKHPHLAVFLVLIFFPDRDSLSVPLSQVTLLARLLSLPSSPFLFSVQTRT
jgi:hypothetical protein